MEMLDNIIFYNIDRAIKTYRQFAQIQLKLHGFTMTIDQWIVLKSIQANPDATLNEIAEKVFKDNASLTRIISLLVKSKYLSRKTMVGNRRRVKLKITVLGLETLAGMEPIILNNRGVALHDLNAEDLQIAKNVMNKITENCNSFHS